LSDVMDFYANAVVYHIEGDAYYRIISNTPGVGTYYFSIEPAADPAFVAGDHFRIYTEWFDKLSLPGSESELNPALHDLMMNFAEAECWATDRQLGRYKSAREIAELWVAALNSRFVQTGIGTQADKRTGGK